MSKCTNMSVPTYAYLLILAFMLTFEMATPSFPMALYDAVYVPKKTDSIFISPANLKATLAVAALAAKGKTQDELLNVIESTSGSLTADSQLPGNVKNLALDRKIYVRKNLIDGGYKAKLEPTYSFQDVVFGSSNTAKTINKAVSGKTKKTIENIFPKSLNKNTALAATNTMYLNAPWKHEFTSTMKRGFKKPMVHQYGDFLFANISELNALAVVLELKENNLQLLVLQPNDNDLKRLGEKLLNEDLTEIPRSLNKTYMSLFFPIIKEIRTSLSLKDVLSSLNLERAFSKKANFANILDACEEDAGINLKEVRQHTSFQSDRQRARFVSVSGLQLDLNNSTRSECSCLADEYLTEFADPDDIEENEILALRKRDAPHYYFERKLFFTLINKHEVLFIGTLAKEK